MPTKAKLVCQVKFLKLQLANALERSHGTLDSKALKYPSFNSIMRLSVHNQVNYVQAQLELEQLAKHQAKIACVREATGSGGNGMGGNAQGDLSKRTVEIRFGMQPQT